MASTLSASSASRTCLVRSPSRQVRGSSRDVCNIVPPIRSMLLTAARFSGTLFSATDAASVGSRAKTPSHPRLSPITSHPRSSAESVMARMHALSPGTSPPPVKTPIFNLATPSPEGPRRTRPPKVRGRWLSMGLFCPFRLLLSGFVMRYHTPSAQRRSAEFSEHEHPQFGGTWQHYSRRLTLVGGRCVGCRGNGGNCFLRLHFPIAGAFGHSPSGSRSSPWAFWPTCRCS